LREIWTKDTNIKQSNNLNKADCRSPMTKIAVNSSCLELWSSSKNKQLNCTHAELLLSFNKLVGIYIYKNLLQSSQKL